MDTLTIDSISYYNPDQDKDGKTKCFGVTNTNEEVKKIIEENFHQERFNIDKKFDGGIEKCRNKAFENNKDFFLTTDAKKEDDKNQITYNCLVPKENRACAFANINSLFNPVNTLINDIFGNENERSIDKINEEDEFKISELTSHLRPDDVPKCFFIKNDEDLKSYFAQNNNFILYKTSLIDNADFNNELTKVRSYQNYKDTYERIFGANAEIIDRELGLEGSGGFKQVFNQYLCNPTNINEKNFDKEIEDLKQYYMNIFTEMDGISRDISSISFITRHDTLYLEKIQKEINDKKKDLRSLLGFDGANNGKFSDTRYLKNLKISEISTILIILVFLIYAYSKKKF